MDTDRCEFTVEYVFAPSVDGEERLAQAYDLIVELILHNLTPEEDAVGAFPNVVDAGDMIHSGQDRVTNPLGESHG